MIKAYAAGICAPCDRAHRDRGRAGSSQTTQRYYINADGTRVTLSRPRARASSWSARSFLDAGTEVLPGERKFTDYAFPPTYQPLDVSTNIGGRVGWHRSPLPGPFDLPGRNNPFGFVSTAAQAASFSISPMIASPISRGAHDLGALRLDVGGAQALGERGGDRLVDQVGFLAHVERIAQRHAERGDHGDRVGNALAGDVGRRAVHRLVQRLALAGLRIDLAERGRGQHAERAGQHRGDVGEHVAEQIVGDDDVELLRPAHELHAAGIGELMLELDVLEFARVQRVTTSFQSTPVFMTLRFSIEVTLLRRLRASSKATRAMRSIS